MLGVVALFPAMRPTAEQVLAEPGVPPMPLATVQLLLLINPALLLLVFTAVGTLLAHRVGLRSHLADRARSGASPGAGVRADVPVAVVVGVVVALCIAAADMLSRPLLGDAAAALAQLEAEQPRTLMFTLAGILYGGITEELITRWGLLSLLAWVAWRVLQRGRGAPHPVIIWTAIVLSAVLFGAGHLGVVAAHMPLTTEVVVRTVALNAAGGAAFGWLFWRRSLEAAMVAHASSHVIFTLIAWAGMFLTTP